MEKINNLKIDFENRVVIVETIKGATQHELDTKEAFAAIGQAWERVSWEARYEYSFTWMGRPIIQLPDDAFRLQELIYKVKPDVIIETGIAHGGSLIFYASLCKAMGRGRVLGVDIEIRPHNRKAIEEHELFSLINLIEGNSISNDTVAKVASFIKPDETVLVILDSCHAKEHVLQELVSYSPFVTRGSYIVAMDGLMEMLAGAPRTSADWQWNNPRSAIMEFIAKNPNFVIEKPSFVFNEGHIDFWITYSPDGVIKRLS